MKKGSALYYFSVFTALVTLILIFAGGLVTSKDAAMSVPDWPTTYGYNMFLFPWKQWTGGIVFEHSHRLIGSLLGVLTIILTFWIIIQEKQRKYLRVMILTTLALIIFQGILGGFFRVVLQIKPIAIFHACLAQIIFCLLSGIALFTSSWWKKSLPSHPMEDRQFFKLTLWMTAALFIQIALGAVMRHTNAGLAIPDFPLIYGNITPPLDFSSLDQINNERIWKWGLDPVSFQQVFIHLAHRLWAIVVLALVFITRFISLKHYASVKPIVVFSSILTTLSILQIGLGALTIWSEKAADMATAHVVTGALMLVGSFLLSLIAFKLSKPTSKAIHVGGLEEIKI